MLLYFKILEDLKRHSKGEEGTLCENIQSSPLLQKPFTNLSQGYLES